MALFLSGIVGLAIILLEEYLLGAFLGISALNFYIVIIPIGAVILGGFLGFVLYLGMSKGIIPFGRLLMGMSIVIGLLSYPAIRYMEYRTTYFQIDEATNKISINRKFQGYPLKDLGINFLDYEKQYLDYDKVSLTFRPHTTLKLPTWGFLNYLDYLLNWICMAFSCFFIFKIAAADTKFCSNCRMFYKEHLLFQFRPNSYQSLIDELPNNLNNMEEFQKKYEANVDNYRGYYQLYQIYCPNCKKGEIQVRHMVIEGNSVSEVEKDRIIIPTYQIS